MPKLKVQAEVGANVTPLERAFAKAKQSAGSLASALKTKLAAAFSVAAVSAVSREVVMYAFNLDVLSRRLGISTKSLQEFNFAAKRSGEDVERVADAIKDLALNRGQALQGSKTKLDIFGAVGISREQLQQLPLEDIANRVFEAVRSGGVAAADQMFVLNELMGESGVRLIPAMTAGFKEAAKAAEDLGAIIDDGIIGQLNELKRVWDDIIDGFKGISVGPVLRVLQVGLAAGEQLEAGVRGLLGASGALVTGRNPAEGFRQGTQPVLDRQRERKEAGLLRQMGIAGGGVAAGAGGESQIAKDTVAAAAAAVAVAKKEEAFKKSQVALDKALFALEFSKLDTVGKRRKLEMDIADLSKRASMEADAALKNQLLTTEAQKRLQLSGIKDPIAAIKSFGAVQSADALARIGGVLGGARRDTVQRDQLNELKTINRHFDRGVEVKEV